VKAHRKTLITAAALFLFATRGLADAHLEIPGPVAFPAAPRSLEELPDFERKLALVQRAFVAFQDGTRPPAGVGGEIFLETKPEERPLKAGEPVLGCDAYLAKVETAREAWEDVQIFAEHILVQIESLRNETEPGALARGFEQLTEAVEVATEKADRVSRDFPSTLFSTPDRLILYSWRVEPQSLFSIWEPGWRLDGVDFGADMLSLPGYTWAGQGLITDVAQVTRAPYTSGRSIVFERAASPASACAGPETIWMHGRTRVTYKRPAQGNPGCPGGQLCPSVTLDPLVHHDVITVTLRGRPDPGWIPGIDVPVPKTVCPKPYTPHERPPVNCPH